MTVRRLQAFARTKSPACKEERGWSGPGQPGPSRHFHARDLGVRWRSRGRSLTQGLDRAAVAHELPREL